MSGKFSFGDVKSRVDPFQDSLSRGAYGGGTLARTRNAFFQSNPDQRIMLGDMNSKRGPNNAPANLSEEFDQNRGSLERGVNESLASEARSNLAKDITGIRAGAQNRGLLYSGLRQGAEQGAQANAASGMAAGRDSVRRQLDRQSQDLKQQQISGDLAQVQMDANYSDMVFQEAMERMRDRSRGLGTLGQGIGTAVGFGLANRNKG